ncbi:MAG: hypothetical protein COV46_08540 [Deltaproteobacteria bacterium CG11_big_fil_rev_8_21_14_0_20_49_13]|nr:MAG: hypothetical protein COV46_08540 [Deltaproteobacteria bacterium CG11_big_fil_rev_8_21_14_0_20_49_13]
MNVIHVDMPMLDTWNQPCFPLASAILGSISKANGLSCLYVEGSRIYSDICKMPQEKISIPERCIDNIFSQIIAIAPKIITFSINHWNQGLCYRILDRLFRSRFSRSKVILGGPQVTLVYEHLFSFLNERFKDVLNDSLFLGVGEAEVVYEKFIKNVCASGIADTSNEKFPGGHLKSGHL